MSTPLLLNDRQVAALMGVNVEMAHTLALQAWFPEPLQLAPGVARWLATDIEGLSEHLRTHFSPAIAAGSKRGTD
jgi:predicted DNA-binding transcriptional regulator AlpA